MSYKEALARWGADQLTAGDRARGVSTDDEGNRVEVIYTAADIDPDTVDVTFEYEKPWSYSEYTGGGGVASVKLSARSHDGFPVSTELESSGGDFTYSLGQLIDWISDYE